MWKNHREKVAIKWEYIQKKKCMYWRVEPPIYTYQIHIVCVIHIDIVIAWLDSKWIVCWGWACFSIAARRIPVNNFSDSNESVRQTRSRRRCGSVWVCVQVIGGEQDISLFCIMHTTYTIARCVCVWLCVIVTVFRFRCFTIVISAVEYAPLLWNGLNLVYGWFG